MQNVQDRAIALWHCFFYLCEKYDREVCTGRGGTPAVEEEMALIGEHAQRARHVLREVARESGVTEGDLDATRKLVSKCGPATNEAEAQRSGLLPLFERFTR